MNRALLAAAAASLVACAPHHEDADADAFRAALPTADQVKLAPPVASNAGSTTQSLRPGLSLETDGPTGGGQAELYVLTRQLFDAANYGTAWVLGTVWTIAQFPPTSIDGNTATWGPGSDALSPAEWKLTITETSPGRYDYVLEGRKKGDPNAAFVPTLKGTGYGSAHDLHGSGTFHLDDDAANDLNPARLRGPDDTGVVDVTYSAALPARKIDVSAHRSAEPSWFQVTVERDASDGGRVDVVAHGDIEKTKDGNLEDMTMKSRWLPDGEGRADVTVTGGDVPSSIGTATIAECWSASFARVYYTDSIGLEPTAGAPSSCAFASAAPLT